MATNLKREATKSADRHGLPAAVFHSLVQHESNWNPAARSPTGAVGLTMLMPETAARLGVDPLDPVQNLDGGARLLRSHVDRFGEMPLALAAYHAGPDTVEEAGGMPHWPEARRYVAAVLHDAGATSSIAERPSRPQVASRMFAPPPGSRRVGQPPRRY